MGPSQIRNLIALYGEQPGGSTASIGRGGLFPSKPGYSDSWGNVITGVGLKGGAGTGVPTQKAAGIAGGLIGTLIPIPFVGTLIGAAIGRTAAKLLQGNPGMSKQQAVAIATKQHAPAADCHM